MMKKRIFAVALAFTLTLGLVACGEKNPSLEEVEAAIAAGNVTMEDALEKGWITQEWVDDYMAENSVESIDKVAVNTIDAFVTTTKDGNEYTEKNVNKTTFLAFLDPSAEESKAYYQELVSGYDGVKAAGGDIVVAARGELNNALFQDAPFAVIEYNDSLQAAMKQNEEMAEANSCIGVWVINNSAISAWYSVVTAEELADSTPDYVQMAEEVFSQNNDDGAAMVIGR